MSLIYKLTATATFPEGAAPGAGASSNGQTIAKNGQGKPVLRGSALAGVLRSAYTALKGIEDPMNAEVSCWFGTAADDETDQESPLKVSDALITSSEETSRTHNMINRHTGATAKNALFSLETLPPGAKTRLALTLTGSPDGNAEAFILDIAGLLAGGLLVGGSSNRGIGRMTADNSLYLTSFDTGTRDGLAKFLDAEYRERRQGIQLEGDLLDLSVSQNNILAIDLKLGIPRGEDLLVGDGQAGDYMAAPQTVIFADGSEHWRIPGSTLRGIFRSWITRLVAREIAKNVKQGQDDAEQRILDSIERFYEAEDSGDPLAYNPHLAGLGFAKTPEAQKEFIKTPNALKDPVMDLFGSMYKKGRIHITDAFSQEIIRPMDAGERMHVAVDRISGGAHEGALFRTRVLAGAHISFPLTITIHTPTRKEVEWLVKTLRALHLGILQVGSSKGGGRLEIKEISAQGPEEEAINAFASEVH